MGGVKDYLGHALCPSGLEFDWLLIHSLEDEGLKGGGGGGVCELQLVVVLPSAGRGRDAKDTDVQVSGDLLADADTVPHQIHS